jgi:VWFA-related protein
MNYSRRQFAFSAASVILAARQARAQDEPSFSSDVQVVNLLATVRNKKSEIIRDLEKDDFSLLEDGRPQAIRYFSRESDLPLTLGLMVDTSMSQVHVLDAERGASFRFLDQVLRENKDHVFVMQFDLTVQTRQPLTGSRRDLNSALTMVDTPTRSQLRSQYGGGTLLYDALVDASQDIMKQQPGRKALIVLSDGGENGSDATLDNVIDAAQRAETLIYAILFTDGGFGSGEGRNIMQRLAKDTGGSYFEVSKKLGIDQVYALIQEDLRSQYSLGYVSDRPAKGAEFRRLQLTVKRPGLIVRSRDRYWAGPPGHPE